MISEFRFRHTSPPPPKTKETDQYDQGQECGGGKVQSRRIAFPVAGDSVQRTVLRRTVLLYIPTAAGAPTLAEKTAPAVNNPSAC